MTLGRIALLLVLLIGGASVGLVNGQPIFFNDSVVYVQSPDPRLGDYSVINSGVGGHGRQTRLLTQLLRAIHIQHRLIGGRNQTLILERQLYSQAVRSITGFFSISHILSVICGWQYSCIQQFLVYLSYTLICTCLNLSFRSFRVDYRGNFSFRVPFRFISVF